jgi:hypothetical protein
MCFRVGPKIAELLQGGPGPLQSRNGGFVPGIRGAPAGELNVIRSQKLGIALRQPGRSGGLDRFAFRGAWFVVGLHGNFSAAAGAKRPSPRS